MQLEKRETYDEARDRQAREIEAMLTHAQGYPYHLVAMIAATMLARATFADAYTGCGKDECKDCQEARREWPQAAGEYLNEAVSRLQFGLQPVAGHA